MRSTVGMFVASGIFCIPAFAQDGLTFDFSGRVGIGSLNTTTETEPSLPRGFGYDGLVLVAEGTGTLDFSLSNGVSLGAVMHASLQKGQQGYYHLINPPFFAGPPQEFDSQDIDLAIYSVVGPVTLSFGEMQTAFELASRRVEAGGSIIDGGSAVWQSIGDAKGSLGVLESDLEGPGVPGDFTTLRADVAISNFMVSFSASRWGSLGDFLDAETVVRSAGLSWQADVGAGEIFAGIGRDRGPEFEFRSASVGWQVEGLNLVLSKVQRTRAPGSFRLPDYELTFTGLSASYEFGDYVIGFATSTQGNRSPYTTFAGDAAAFWIGWDPQENVSVDFEVSQNDYDASTTHDTRKASLAVSYQF